MVGADAHHLAKAAIHTVTHIARGLVPHLDHQWMVVEGGIRQEAVVVPLVEVG